MRAKNQRLESKMEKSKSTVSDVGDTIRNTIAGMENALSWRDGAGNAIGKLRCIERLFHLEDEIENTQQEWGNLEGVKNAADLRNKGELVHPQKENVREKESPKSRVKKLEKEIEKGGFKGLIIDRTKTHGGLILK